MSGDWSDFCECFFARMRSNVQQFQNILSNNRDSYYNGPNGGTPDDPFALDGTSGGNDGGLSSTTLLMTMFLILIIGVLFSMQKNTKKAEPETVDCRPINSDRNDRNFDPPEID
mmetsp:Transcript_28483/g.25145  ORF Transcript_28483/g.25145 Transcript_28483/m.25145 type:complete len:114 (-) Transcript_28483:340-681(-)|eukprot:CAMPEP_0201578824 /NCGR_PEP_ID=MMETSP0190_2-20130828/25892_1 /ASSEMBLY_ACC=CAM_ASM_000263 /TAXON_ID=37353 /ORGANISM="Rosalina sp." /LENGTH=113 /DNA_ID=CAMNT_0048012421 /DNA_START=72 /DNA_END=413 /DNA_ORIENTATION=-